MVDLLEYAFLGMAAAATIGPVTIETVRRGLKGGFAPAFLVNMGATAVDAAYLLLIFFGLSSFVSNPAFRMALGLFGAAVLIYFGANSIREYFAGGEILGRKPSGKSGNDFVAGMLINISNPMAIMAWLAFYGIVSAGMGGAGGYATLLNLFFVVAGTALWGVILSLMAHLGKGILTKKALGYVSLASGIILIGFGLYFGYSGLIA